MGNLKTNDPEIYREWLREVKDRHGAAAAKYPLFEYLPCPGAGVLLIGFGIASRVMLSLRDRYSLFRPVRILPLLEAELREICRPYRQVVVVEGGDGQYAGWVECALERKVLKVACQGGGFTLRWIESQIAERLKGERA